MSPRGAVLVVGALALLGAGLVALAARAPAALRTARPPADATDARRRGFGGLGVLDAGPPRERGFGGADFSARQKRRAAAYNGPSYLAFGVATLLRVALLGVLARGPWRRLIDALAGLRGGWPARTVVAACVVALLASLVTLPLGYVRGYAIEHAWGLSTQDIGGWASDRLRSLMVGACTTVVAALVFFGVVRWQPRTWWLWGWAIFSLLSILFVLLWPVAVAPLFNRFTPLRDSGLSTAVTDLARRAGVDVDAVLVADASRRTIAQNAYMAGIGRTKRLVVYDTLLQAGGRRETLWVVGHELGHEAERHVLKGALLSSAGLFVGFAVLAWLAVRPWVWSWAGANGVGDLKALPVLLLFATGAALVSLPVENAVARGWERRADAIALELTGDPQAAVAVLRRIALRNLSDLDPPEVAVALLYSHPPIRERILAALGKTHLPP
jgi:STE24 endopeptidase